MCMFVANCFHRCRMYHFRNSSGRCVDNYSLGRSLLHRIVRRIGFDFGRDKIHLEG